MTPFRSSLKQWAEEAQTPRGVATEPAQATQAGSTRPETRTQIWLCNLCSDHGAIPQHLGSTCLSWGTHREWQLRGPQAQGLHDQAPDLRAAQAVWGTHRHLPPLTGGRKVWRGDWLGMAMIKSFCYWNYYFLPWLPESSFPGAETRFCWSFHLSHPTGKNAVFNLVSE